MFQNLSPVTRHSEHVKQPHVHSLSPTVEILGVASEWEASKLYVRSASRQKFIQAAVLAVHSTLSCVAGCAWGKLPNATATKETQRKKKSQYHPSFMQASISARNGEQHQAQHVQGGEIVSLCCKVTSDLLGQIQI